MRPSLTTSRSVSSKWTGPASITMWVSHSFSPEHASAHLAHIEKGALAAGRTLADIELNAAVAIGIGDDVQGMIEKRKAGVAFTMGGMGSANTNFYNAAFQRAGYEDEAAAIQRLWIEGKRKEAIALVPDSMVTEFQAVGTREMVRDRLRMYRDVGIHALTRRYGQRLLGKASSGLDKLRIVQCDQRLQRRVSPLAPHRAHLAAGRIKGVHVGRRR